MEKETYKKRHIDVIFFIDMILYPAKLTVSTIPSVTKKTKLTTPAVTMSSVTSASSSMAGQPSAGAGQHNHRRTPVHDAVVQTPLGTYNNSLHT